MFRRSFVVVLCLLALLHVVRTTAQEQRPSLPAELQAAVDERRHEEVLQRSTELLANTPEADRATRIALLDLKAKAHYSLQQLADASKAAQDLLAVAREQGDTAAMIGALRIVSNTTDDGNRFEDALRTDREIYRLALHFGNADLLIEATHALGGRFLMVEEYDSTEHYYLEGLSIAPLDHPLRTNFEANLGKLYSETGRHEEAIAQVERVLANMRAEDHPRTYKMVNMLGFVMHNADRHREAIALFAESEEMNQAGPQDLYTSLENLGFAAESQAAIGDHAAAYTSMVQLEELLHAFYARTANEQLLEQEKRFETKLKEEEIERLDAVTNEQAALLRARNLMLYGSLGTLLLALVAAVLLWRNFRQERRHAGVLEQLNTELKDQKQRIEDINRLLQLKVLRTQMNPHFIYNCLNAINNLVRKGDAVGATSYLDGFARLLRMVLDHSVKDRVPISEELDFLRQYLKLEALRFPDGLHYEVDADRDLLDEDVPVPTLLVQPFVENAIWHGLANKEGEKRLSVRFEEHGESLRCVVEDNGVGRKAAPPRAHSDGSPSMGLQLTNERLQLLSYKLEEQGRALRFEDLVAPDGSPAGTRVELKLG